MEVNQMRDYLWRSIRRELRSLRCLDQGELGWRDQQIITCEDDAFSNGEQDVFSNGGIGKKGLPVGRREDADVDKLTKENRWSEHLPDDLVEMVVKRLSLVDSIRFAAVCTSWRSVSSQWFQRATRVPWLMRAVKFLDSTTAQYNFYSPSEDRVYKLKFPRDTNNTGYSNLDSIFCAGSVGGWLIMTEFSRPNVWRNYFFNPMTGARLMLPPLEGAVPWSSVASSDPNCSDCIVAAITFNTSQLVFCRPSDESWTFQQMKDECMARIQFHEDGKLYAIGQKTCTEYIVVFDPLEVLDQGKGKSAFMGKRLSFRNLLSEHSIGEPFSPCFTRSSLGELLLLWEPLSPFVYKFLVFRLDANTTDPKCVNMNSLGGQMFFIDWKHAITISKSKLTNTMTTMADEAFLELGYEKNYICYCPDVPEPAQVKKFRGCDLADGTYKLVSTSGIEPPSWKTSEIYRTSICKPSGTWFTPKLS